MHILHLMLRLPQKRGTVKWVGVAACALLFCGWIGTFWLAFGYQTSTVSIDLMLGCFNTSLYPAGLPTHGWFAASMPYEVYWLPKLIHGRYSGVRTTHLFVPLWMPLLAVGSATILCWRRDRRYPPGHCQKCGYDLTGNTSGACPECGVAVAQGQVQTT